MTKKILNGKVIRDKNDKTVVVLVKRKYIHPFFKKANEKWQKEHKLPDNIAEIVHNRVLGQGSFEVLNIAKKLNLPPPFKIEIPQIKIGKKGVSKNNDTGPEVA